MADGRNIFGRGFESAGRFLARVGGVAGAPVRWVRETFRWALAGGPLIYRAAQPFRPLLHLFAFYPLLCLLVLLVTGLVWGGLLGEYDVFHLIWNEHPAVGVANGVAVAMILGGALLATYLLDGVRTNIVVPPDPHEEPACGAGQQTVVVLKPVDLVNYWVAWWVLLAVVVVPALAGECFRVRYPVAVGGEFESPCDPPAAATIDGTVLSVYGGAFPRGWLEPSFNTLCWGTFLARVGFPLGVLLCGVTFTMCRLWLAVKDAAADEKVMPRVAQWLWDRLLTGYVILLVIHVLIGSDLLRWSGMRPDWHLSPPPGGWVWAWQNPTWLAALAVIVALNLAPRWGRGAATTAAAKPPTRYHRWVGWAMQTRVGRTVEVTAWVVLLAPVIFPLPTSVSVLLLLGLLTATAWRFTRVALRRKWWLYPAAFGLLLLPFMIHGLQTHYCLPGMGIGGGEETYYGTGKRANLNNYELDRQDPDKRTKAGLLDDADTLKKWHARMKDRYGKPRPVVAVTVSGGASASALYSADVLFTLELETPGLSDQIRVIGGASGGMLGAAYFVAQLRPGTELAAARTTHAAAWKKRYGGGASGGEEADREYAAARDGYRTVVAAFREKARRELGQDFLSPLIQQWVHKDLPLFYAYPFETTNDRGRALELSWGRLLRVTLNGTDEGALDVPVKDLRAAEADADIPSLIFSPMMIEDGRQLLISNLDLNYMVDSRITDPDRKERAGVPQDKPSHTGLEFFRLFPAADKFKLSTAVRMNASFPYLNPSAALPTNPERHVVDAGYFDNYGTLTGTRWIARHTSWFNGEWYSDSGLRSPEVTPAVYLLQIRCFGYDTQTRDFVNKTERQEIVRRGAGGVARTESGLFTMTAPLTGLFASWKANMVYRGDERVDMLEQYIRKQDDYDNGVRVARILYECPFDPSLNWILTDAERWRLSAGGGGMIQTDFERVRRENSLSRANREAGLAAVAGFPITTALPTSHQPPVEQPQDPRGRVPAAGRREFYWRLLEQAAGR